MNSYDYDSILERMKTKLLSKLDAKEMLLYSTNAYTLEVVSEEFEGIVGYNENLFREAIWDEAQNRSSVFGQAGFFSYRPHRMIGANGYLRLSSSSAFNGGHAYNITIPAFSKFSNGTYTFTNPVLATIPAQSKYLDINIVQGTPQSYEVEITSAAFPNGTLYAKVAVDNSKIENTHYAVYVNGILWMEIDDIRLADDGDATVYTIKTLSDYSGVVIRFGNGVFGKSLVVGDKVKFTYIETDGSDGNVLSSGIVTTVESTFYDEQGTKVQLYCTNTSTLTNGDDEEDLESIKANAPRTYQTSNRAISTSDYITLVKKSGSVDRVIVWGEKEINEDAGNKPGTYIATTENLLYIAGFNIHPTTGLGIPLSSSDQTVIRNYLNDRKGATDILQFVDVEFVYITFIVSAIISDRSYTTEQVRASIITALKKNYSLSAESFKTNLYLSDYYRVLDNVDGVDHHTTTLTFSEMFSFKSAYEFTANLHLAAIKANSVSIKVRNLNAEMDWTEIARDDGTGNLVGVAIGASDEKYSLPGATISYEDGAIGTVLVTSGLSGAYSSYDIRIDFELDNTDEIGNLILTKRQQILSYYASTINVAFADA